MMSCRLQINTLAMLFSLVANNSLEANITIAYFIILDAQPNQIFLTYASNFGLIYVFILLSIALLMTCFCTVVLQREASCSSWLWSLSTCACILALDHCKLQLATEPCKLKLSNYLVDIKIVKMYQICFCGNELNCSWTFPNKNIFMLFSS